MVIGTNAPLPKAHALSKSALWLERNKSLLVSGRVWDVAKLATDYKVPVASKCWEYLLNGRTGENKSLVCPSPGRPGHGSPTDAAHVLEGFDRDSALDKYSVAATPVQRQRLAKIMAEVGRVGGREMCDFGDATDPLTVAFPVGFAPEIEVWGAAEEIEAPRGGAEWALPSGPDSYYTLPIPPMPYVRRADGDTEPLRKPLMADCRTAAVTNLLRRMPGITAVGNRGEGDCAPLALDFGVGAPSRDRVQERRSDLVRYARKNPGLLLIEFPSTEAITLHHGRRGLSQVRRLVPRRADL